MARRAQQPDPQRVTDRARVRALRLRQRRLVVHLGPAFEAPAGQALARHHRPARERDATHRREASGDHLLSVARRERPPPRGVAAGARVATLLLDHSGVRRATPAPHKGPAAWRRAGAQQGVRHADLARERGSVQGKRGLNGQAPTRQDAEQESGGSGHCILPPRWRRAATGASLWFPKQSETASSCEPLRRCPLFPLVAVHFLGTDPPETPHPMRAHLAAANQFPHGLRVDPPMGRQRGRREVCGGRRRGRHRPT